MVICQIPSLCKNCAKQAGIHLSNPSGSSVKEGLALASSYRWENWAQKGKVNCPKFIPGKYQSQNVNLGSLAPKTIPDHSAKKFMLLL